MCRWSQCVFGSELAPSRRILIFAPHASPKAKGKCLLFSFASTLRLPESLAWELPRGKPEPTKTGFAVKDGYMVSAMVSGLW